MKPLGARLEGLAEPAGGSAPGESRARLGLARPDDRTSRSCAALLGETWDSAGEFVPRFGASGALNVRSVLVGGAVDADLAPRGRNRLVGGLGVETESIARCSAIMISRANRFLLSN